MVAEQDWNTRWGHLTNLWFTYMTYWPPAGACHLSRWWTWAAVSWSTECRTTSRVRLSTTLWTSMCTRTPSTCAGTERATTTWRAALEETLNFLPKGNRCDRRGSGWLFSLTFVIILFTGLGEPKADKAKVPLKTLSVSLATSVRPRPERFHQWAQSVRSEGVDEPTEKNNPDSGGTGSPLRTVEDT